MNSSVFHSFRIGRGGYGKVFRGKDTRWPTDNAVAVKEVEKNERTEKYIDRERRLLNCCKHKNIVEMFDIQEQNNAMYIVMEYCWVGNLNQYVETNLLTYEMCFSFMKDLTMAVDFLHNERNVYHRDIKPDNVLIGDALVAKLADFGLAKEYYVASSSAEPGSFAGTFPWMPPEMHKKPIKYDYAVDIFPLGLLFFAMVTLLPERGTLHPITGEYLCT